MIIILARRAWITLRKLRSIQATPAERQLLLRLVRKRFGEAVMERSRALLERVEEMAVLEELGEVVLDCADGEAWLAILARRAN